MAGPIIGEKPANEGGVNRQAYDAEGKFAGKESAGGALGGLFSSFDSLLEAARIDGFDDRKVLSKVENRKNFDINAADIISLANFKETRKENIRKHKDDFSFWNPQQLKKLRSIFDDILSKSALCMRISAKYLKNIVIGGDHFKNQTESGTSKGAHSTYIRSRYSHDTFGSKLKDYETRSREKFGMEKYGFLNDADLKKGMTAGIADWYSDDRTYVAFKKEKVQDRVTLTVGDSLGGQQIPQLISEPMDQYVFRPGSSRPYGEKLEFHGSVLGYTNGFGISYIELQYHGYFDSSDIDYICMRPSETLENADLIEGAIAKGIKCYTLKNGRVCSIGISNDGIYLTDNETGERVI